MRVTLIIEHGGKFEGRRITLRQLPFVIGRHPTCHLRPNSRAVSKTHCALEAGDEGLILRDFDSTNGTLVNGHLLRGGRIQLFDGDEVAIGPLAFVVRIAREPATPQLEQPTAAPIEVSVPAAAAPGEAEAIPLDEDDLLPDDEVVTPEPETDAAAPDADTAGDAADRPLNQLRRRNHAPVH